MDSSNHYPTPDSTRHPQSYSSYLDRTMTNSTITTSQRPETMGNPMSPGMKSPSGTTRSRQSLLHPPIPPSRTSSLFPTPSSPESVLPTVQVIQPTPTKPRVRRKKSDEGKGDVDLDSISLKAEVTTSPRGISPRLLFQRKNTLVVKVDNKETSTSNPWSSKSRGRSVDDDGEGESEDEEEVEKKSKEEARLARAREKNRERQRRKRARDKDKEDAKRNLEAIQTTPLSSTFPSPSHLPFSTRNLSQPNLLGSAMHDYPSSNPSFTVLPQLNVLSSSYPLSNSFSSLSPNQFSTSGTSSPGLFSPAMSTSTSGGSVFFASTECLSLNAYGTGSGEFGRDDERLKPHSGRSDHFDPNTANASATTSRRPSPSLYRNTSNRSSMTVQVPDFHTSLLQHNPTPYLETPLQPRRSGPSPAKRRKSEPEPEEFRGPKNLDMGLGLINTPQSSSSRGKEGVQTRPKVRRTTSNPEGMGVEFAGLGLGFDDGENDRRSMTPPPVPTLPEEYRKISRQIGAPLSNTMSGTSTTVFDTPQRTNPDSVTVVQSGSKTTTKLSAITVPKSSKALPNRALMSNPSNDGTFFASSLLMALDNCTDLKTIVESKLGISKKELESMMGGLAGVYDNWKAGLEVEMSRVSLEERGEGDNPRRKTDVEMSKSGPFTSPMKTLKEGFITPARPSSSRRRTPTPLTATSSMPANLSLESHSQPTTATPSTSSTNNHSRTRSLSSTALFIRQELAHQTPHQTSLTMPPLAGSDNTPIRYMPATPHANTTSSPNIQTPLEYHQPQWIDTPTHPHAHHEPPQSHQGTYDTGESLWMTPKTSVLNRPRPATSGRHVLESPLVMGTSGRGRSASNVSGGKRFPGSMGMVGISESQPGSSSRQPQDGEMRPPSTSPFIYSNLSPNPNPNDIVDTAPAPHASTARPTSEYNAHPTLAQVAYQPSMAYDPNYMSFQTPHRNRSNTLPSGNMAYTSPVLGIGSGAVHGTPGSGVGDGSGFTQEGRFYGGFAFDPQGSSAHNGRDQGGGYTQ